ncbi:hypothetical protein BWI17_00320 [Betaproteobacteria bacterium GR16-43]|nr:hypothetical protein BWI17_00320 [Betaproteobacteria bacterium GR16-43]
MTLHRAAATALVLALLPIAASSQEASTVGDALLERGLRVVSVVAPDYPKDFLARGEGATLDVEARVLADGAIDPATLRLAGANDAFAAAVREVARHWLFMPRLDPSTCNGTAGDLGMKVWFEVADGKPKVSVSQPAGDATPESQAAKSGSSANMLRKKSGNQVAYPENAFRGGVEGTVAIAAKVDRTGQVSNVEVRPGLYKRWFEREILQAVPYWQFEVLSEYPKDKEFVCAEFIADFRIHDNRIPPPGGISDLRRRTRQN